MRVNLAVRDYMDMFPEEYKATLEVVERQRAGLDNEMAKLKTTHHMERMIATLPEKLYQMIQQKLGTEEMPEFNAKDSQRWFVTEWPQFRITAHV